MPDASYRTSNLLLRSRGISARPVDDTLAESAFLNLDNAEETAENAVGSRLGSTIINKTGVTVNALPGLVHSVIKLAGLNNVAWRYAGSGTGLYRRNAAGTGPYTSIANTLSGNPWQAIAYRPNLSSYPYLFIADLAGMLKDNGTLAAPQQLGIFQPQYPVQAQAQAPDLITLDNYLTATGYTTSGVSGLAVSSYVNTTLTSAVTATGINTVTVANPTQPGLFQLLTIDSGPSQETVLVIEVTPAGFVANFTKTHTAGAAVASEQLTFTVPISSTGTVSKSFAGTPIAAWPATLQLADYIGLYLYVSDPNQIQSITLKFDCGDGSFNTDYFYKVIGQGPLQQLLNNVSDPATAATDAALSESLGLYGNDSTSLASLNEGLAVWTPLLAQLSDFASAGRANFGDPVFNWSAVNGYQIEVVTNSNTSATIGLAALILFGGAGPDSLGGVAYDWAFTFFNPDDGTESNPCMFMSNINPPLNTNWITPRRQPVVLTLTHPTVDPQAKRIRVYRRGGSLGDNFRRVNEIPCSGASTTYTDIAADQDIQGADLLSLVNDVPVTSTLPVPVNTTLQTAITTTNQVVSVYPVSMDNISVRQLVSLGSLTATGLTSNFETVVVLTVASDHFTAFVQNTHAVGETISATAKVGQPVSGIALAFNITWYWGDPNNPHYLYYSAASNPQAVGAASYVEVGTPDDPITVVVPFKGNLYVSTQKFWYSIAPGTQAGAVPTVYPTSAKHGCVAPLGYLVTEEAIYYQAIDGIRAFAGGSSTYLTQDQEFIFQGVGSTPIVQADPAQIAKTRAAYWNNMNFFSYIGLDGNRHRLIFHTIYKRWRNDDVDAQSLFLEADTNTLVFGDSTGLVRADRTGSYDEINNAGAVQQSPIAVNIQTAYLDMGAPAEQKVYNSFTLDCNTGGQPATVTLLLNDGASSLVLGTVTTSQRSRVNLNVNNGDGVEAYKVALKITGAFTQPAYFYQAAIQSLVLAITRKSFDTWELKFSDDGSKVAKNLFLDYSSTSTVSLTVTFDNTAVAPYLLTLPSTGGARSVLRLRLPPVKFRLARLVVTAGQDFQLWNDSRWEVKPVCAGKGYEFFPLMSVEG
jgi:hypothetical protein